MFFSIILFLLFESPDLFHLGQFALQLAEGNAEYPRRLAAVATGGI